MKTKKIFSIISFVMISCSYFGQCGYSTQLEKGRNMTSIYCEGGSDWGVKVDEIIRNSFGQPTQKNKYLLIEKEAIIEVKIKKNKKLYSFKIKAPGIDNIFLDDELRKIIIDIENIK